MSQEYKRPTKIIDLPSGKKVEVIAYFSKYETEKLASAMFDKQKISGEKLSGIGKEGGAAFNGMEFELGALTMADGMAREMAIKKLIDVDGKEYEATIEAIRDFLDEADGDVVTAAINDANKKKPKEGK
ncbi:MAG: hypothetical protein WA082_04455 [Candidatus Moraniibacteriota bacterium]